MWSEIQAAVSLVNDSLLRDVLEKTFSFHSSISEEKGLCGSVCWITLRIRFFKDRVKRGLVLTIDVVIYIDGFNYGRSEFVLALSIIIYTAQCRKNLSIDRHDSRYQCVL